MYEIEKDVPVGVHGNARYPFSKMEAGDSFFVPAEAGVAENTIRRCAAMYGQRNGVKMTCKKVDGGMRVWRLS